MDHTKRQRLRSNVPWSIALVFIGTAIIAAAAVLYDGNHSLTTLATAGLLLYAGISAFALARATVTVDPASPAFVVQNMFRRYTVHWADISEFRPGRFSDWLSVPYQDTAVLAVAADGRELALQGLNSRCPEYAEMLNAELERRRASPAGPDALPPASPGSAPCREPSGR